MHGRLTKRDSSQGSTYQLVLCPRKLPLYPRDSLYSPRLFSKWRSPIGAPGGTTDLCHCFGPNLRIQRTKPIEATLSHLCVGADHRYGVAQFIDRQRVVMLTHGERFANERSIGSIHLVPITSRRANVTTPSSTYPAPGFLPCSIPALFDRRMAFERSSDYVHKAIDVKGFQDYINAHLA